MDNKNYRIAKDGLLDDSTNLFEITIAAAREAKKLNALAKNRALQLEEKPLVTAFNKLQNKELNYHYADEEEILEKPDKSEKKKL
ncbi:hypothetical protein JXL83_02370 [candidate division WOR-3 bacterium]|nr:hypothetical protein [candidate division WOR-3 bacterium]